MDLESEISEILESLENSIDNDKARIKILESRLRVMEGELALTKQELAKLRSNQQNGNLKPKLERQTKYGPQEIAMIKQEIVEKLHQADFIISKSPEFSGPMSSSSGYTTGEIKDLLDTLIVIDEYHW